MRNPINLQEIGQRIKRERLANGLTQERLAEQVNITTHYIYEIERGSKTMSIAILAAISSALNISTDYILFGQDDNNEKKQELILQISKLSPSQKNKISEILRFLLKITDEI
ncbi:MAG: helix-turn-helix domain-containing protein [Acutalibacteraceae bacterium]|nr:helix-turn-helix transcriptional regulator [Bacillota bacterium]